jgi:hypothetical protein
MGQIYIPGATGCGPCVPCSSRLLDRHFCSPYIPGSFFSISNAMESRFGLTARRLTGLFVWALS